MSQCDYLVASLLTAPAPPCLMHHLPFCGPFASAAWPRVQVHPGREKEEGEEALGKWGTGGRGRGAYPGAGAYNPETLKILL